MRAVDIIMKKRNGSSLTKEELAYIIQGYVAGDIPEYQISALLMAIFFNGMSFEETAALTELMLQSGDVIHLDGIEGPFVDKHSTGGVGDKLSLILAPMVAACGVRVPMMSGRALGHTGGTLDKLESITGYRTQLDEATFRKIIQSCGFAMTGQTEKIVPADKKLYALRDVTATVESIPLITASILSKKVAEGADALVFDVKSGPGAFMKTIEDAERLANSLVKTGKTMGKKIVGVITDMTEPLGRKVGNFFEVEESIDCLKGTGPQDVMDITYRLGGWMLVLGGKARTVEEGIDQCKTAIKSGKAWDLFIKNIELQGGDSADMMKKYGNYRAPLVKKIKAPKSGFIASIDAYKIGLAGVYIGVGRNKTTDSVHPDVGFIFDKVKGDSVSSGDTIASVFAHSETALDAAWPLIEASLTIADQKPDHAPLIIKEITAL
mgnify:FL=1